MRYEELLNFLDHDMRMSHVYQPVMIDTLLATGGRASIADIARALLNEDRSQLEYYSEITKNMVGQVLARHEVVHRDGQHFKLIDFDDFSAEQVQKLREVCAQKVADYTARRGNAIWDHRRQGAGYITGTLRYEVLKAAKFRCDLCGTSAEERALDVDHIVPRKKGGSDDRSNLQALCYSCNAMKRDRDDTDFRLVRASLEQREAGCAFCSLENRGVLLENSLAAVIRDLYPVTEWHLLVIPKRHTPDYFDLATAEQRACHQLLTEARTIVRDKDAQVSGFNVGVNSGMSAGQTVMHCHIHLIPRRPGDSPNPRGGIRAVIPGKADYTSGGTN